MKRYTLQGSKVVALVAAGAVAATMGTALAEAGQRLFVGGQTASTDVRIIGGRPYVPLADMARAMNGTLVKHRGGGYDINQSGVDTTTPEAGSHRHNGGGAVAAGGANEVRGLRGRIGDTLFNGKWRFAVLSVDHAASYDSQFLGAPRTFTPSGDSDELVIVRCRMKNGQKDSAVAMLSPIHPAHTALADKNGQAYAPLDYDKRGGHTDEGPTMLPGAQTEFAIVFNVPRNTALQDLVFSIQNAYEEPGTDVRITLAP